MIFNEKIEAATLQVAWTIQVSNAKIQSHTFYLQEKEICYLSAHTKLAGFGKMVRLSNMGLAQDFIEASGDILKKRHGDDLLLTVESVSGSFREKDFDDPIVMARVNEQNFVPNKSPNILNAKLEFSINFNVLLNAKNSKKGEFDPLASLDRKTYGVYLMWKSGDDLKTIFGRSQLYRYRKSILLTGIDIFNNPPSLL